MSSLGDFFGESERKEFAERQLKVGTVIKCLQYNTRPLKLKYFIIIGCDNSTTFLATVYINTIINKNVFPTKELENFHYKILKQENDYLEYDSFVNCHKLIIQDSVTLAEIINNSTECVEGEITDKDLAEIRKLIKSSPGVSPKEKKKYLLT